LHQIPLHLLNQSSSNLLIHNILQPLLDFDCQNDTKLVHTLKVYFSCNYNASQAAKILYLHRNTMLNRLEKIKEILQTDFNNSNENILIYLSLAALEV
jgi:PucR family transcriptional regulator, purine catabolism regulatory protein